jgi:radical SAM protein with 4Fe4S-binding SPASM domain
MVHLGFPEYSVGTYFPDVEIKEKELQKYEAQPAHHVEECNACDLKYACGGRCVPSLLALNTPPCPDVKEIMQFGFDYYLPMIEEEWLQK